MTLEDFARNNSVSSRTIHKVESILAIDSWRNHQKEVATFIKRYPNTRGYPYNKKITYNNLASKYSVCSNTIKTLARNLGASKNEDIEWTLIIDFLEKHTHKEVLEFNLKHKDTSFMGDKDYKKKRAYLSKKYAKDTYNKGKETLQKKHKDCKTKGEFSKTEVSKLLGITQKTLNSIVEYLNLELKRVYDPKGRCFINALTENQLSILKKFIEDTPNRRSLLAKNTLKNRYGVSSSLEAHFIKDTNDSKEKLSNRIKQTTIERYGSLSVYYRYKYDNIKFDSADELYYYIYNKEILSNSITRGKSFKYYFNKKEKVYECDFLLNNKTNIEIKGSQFKKNQKLYFPFHSDKTYSVEVKQKEWSAKYECMLKNNVTIIWSDSDEMKFIKNVIDKKYTSDYVNLFRVNGTFQEVFKKQINKNHPLLEYLQRVDIKDRWLDKTFIQNECNLFFNSRL